MMDKYESQYAAYMSLKEQNQVLEAQKKSASAGLSKENVVGAMTQKANGIEDQSKQTEKMYLKQQDMDLKNFLKTYVDQRKEFHMTQLLKVKVQQCWISNLVWQVYAYIL